MSLSAHINELILMYHMLDCCFKLNAIFNCRVVGRDLVSIITVTNVFAMTLSIHYFSIQLFLIFSTFLADTCRSLAIIMVKCYIFSTSNIRLYMYCIYFVILPLLEVIHVLALLSGEKELIIY